MGRLQRARKKYLQGAALMRIIIALFIASFSSVANDFIPNLEKIILKAESVEISKACNNCMAQQKYLSLNKEDLERIRVHIFGGRTWGNQVCLKIFNAKIVSVYDKDRNEAHYCQFKDLSYISTDELNYLSLKLIK